MIADITGQLVTELGYQPGTALENEVVIILARFKAPRPEQQRKAGRYRLDFAWPQVGIALEADGWHHRSPDGAAKDRPARLVAAVARLDRLPGRRRARRECAEAPGGARRPACPRRARLPARRLVAVVIVSLPDDAVGQLAGLALAEADRLGQRTRERRAAVTLMVALEDTRSVDSARKAIAGFADPRTAIDALELLGRLATQLTATTRTTGP